MFLVDGGLLILITPVMRSKYSDKYNEHLRSISVNYDEVVKLVSELFGGMAEQESQYFGDYGEELTIVATKK